MVEIELLTRDSCLRLLGGEQCIIITYELTNKRARKTLFIYYIKIFCLIPDIPRMKRVADATEKIVEEKLKYVRMYIAVSATF